VATLKVQGSLGGRAASFMVDSGATTNFADQALVRRLGLMSKVQSTRCRVTLGNGSSVPAAGVLTISCRLHASDGAFSSTERFLVLPLGAQHPLILGRTWLARHDPDIRWDATDPTIWLRGKAGEARARELAVRLHVLTDEQLPVKARERAAALRREVATALGALHPDDLASLLDGLEVAPAGGDETAARLCALDGAAAAAPLSAAERAQCEAARARLFAAFGDVTPDELPSVLPPSRGIEHKIELLPGAVPQSRPMWRKSREEVDELRKQTQAMLRQGLIQPSKSPYGAPWLFVKKKDGTLRLVVDYRALNNVTKKNSYPLPLQEELFDQTQGARWFSKIDLMNGFYQIRVAEADTEKTAFRTPFGHYEFRVLPMGLTNAPATFMQLMNDQFRDFLGESVIVFLDDILIYSKTLEEHEKHVSAVFERLRKAKLYAKRSKCELFLPEVEFLGHRLGRGFIGTSADKVAAVAAWPVPANLKQLRSFLGLAGYYRKFVQDFSKIATPLTALTEKARAFEWGEPQQTAFLQLKAALQSQPTLRLVDPALPLVVSTDASGYAVGAVLQQRAEGKLQPCEYLSKRMGTAARRYPVHDKELLAIVTALRQWGHHLMGRHFVVRTDHLSLRYFNTQKRLSERQARWRDELTHYDFEIAYEPGVNNQAADGLSRRPDLEADGADETGDLVSEQEHLAAVSAQARAQVRAERRRARVARQPDAAVEREREANRAAAVDVKAAVGPLPPPNAAGAIVMPSQRCTATTRAGAHCKQRTLRGQYCHNHARTEEGLRVKASTIPHAGMGLFAERDFRRGDKAGAYSGDRVRLDVAGGTGGPYVLQVKRGVGIDAARTNAGYGRWANDPRGSGKPANAAFRVSTADGGRACLRTTRAVARGAELLVPYGAGYWRAQPEALAKQVALAAATVLPLGGMDLLPALKAACLDDASYQQLLEQAGASETARTPAGDEARDGLLWRRGRICVPSDAVLRTRLLRECHDTPLGGHLGREKTLLALKQRFYWRGMDAHVEAYVVSCDACQRAKPSQQLPMGLTMPLPAPTRPWEQVSLDLITGLPRTTEGHDAIAVFVCKLTKMVRYAATTTNVTAPQLAELFLHAVVAHHGFPRSLLSDRDPRFTAHFWTVLWSRVGTTLAMSTAYHPQTDGQTERANRTLETMLRSVVNFKQSDWHKHLPLAQLAYNTAVQTTTGISPFELVYGRKAVLPLDHALAPLRDSVAPCPTAEEFAERMKAMWTRAQQAIAAAGLRQAAAADKRLRAAAFAVGDKVMLSTEHLQLVDARQRTAKFADRFIGPFEVERVVNANAYRLRLPASLRLHPTINVQRLKRYEASDERLFPGRAGAATRPEPVASSDNGAPAWEVERILGHRVVRRKREYLVAWAGYGQWEATWEPEECVDNAPEAIADYERRQSELDAVRGPLGPRTGERR
jgi:Reverse transcriptase (RNA-dependent DNA polymerase)/RNase H-like domain found in reverse transcriptase/Integrase zinc binding domain/Chromo (CHRromatin Organisation MOdifier) domain/Aspartyl protease